MATVPETLLDQARQQLARQESKLDQLRVLAAVAITGGGVVAGFVAPGATAAAGWWTAIPVAVFAVMCVLAALVLMPREGLIFSLDLTASLGWAKTLPPGQSGDELALQFAGKLNEATDLNRPVIDQLADRTAWVAGLFALEVTVWLIILVAK